MAEIATDALKPLTKACSRCRMDYHKVRNLIIRGEVRGTQVGGKWLADEGDLLRWKDADSQEPVSAA